VLGFVFISLPLLQVLLQVRLLPGLLLQVLLCLRSFVLLHR
jgi:hypothetical protein